MATELPTRLHADSFITRSFSASVEVDTYHEESILPDTTVDRINNFVKESLLPIYAEGLKTPAMDTFIESLDLQFNTTEEKIYAVLTEYFPKEWSNGDRPDVEHAEKNIAAIRQAIELDTAIPVSTVIATLLFPPTIDHEEPGLLGALMVNRFHQIDQLVRRLYEPGIDVTMYAEDLATHVYFDHASDPQTVEISQMQYLASLTNIISAYESVYGRHIIHLEKESSLCSKYDIGYTDYEARCARYQQIVFDYLEQTSTLLHDHNQMEIFNNDLAEKTGWMGGISKKVRDFLAKRIVKSGQNTIEHQAAINWQIAGLTAVTLEKRTIS